MEIPLSPPPKLPDPQTVTGLDYAAELKQYSDPTIENHPPSIRKKKRLSKDKDEEVKEDSSIGIPPSTSSANKGTGLTLRRRKSRCPFSLGWRNGGRSLEAAALPLGMSFAAVVAQVLERQDTRSERISADHLSMICTSAVRESLSNVFGDKYDSFVENFEKSFRSTFRTLRLINESSMQKGICPSANNNVEQISILPLGCTSKSDINNIHLETEILSVAENRLNNCQEVEENNYVDRGIAILENSNQLACVTSNAGSSINQSAFEKSFIEQVRFNDLKTLELGLTMRKLKLKESLLAVNLDSNYLERSKLAIGVSKASFRAEKFKNQVEDTRHAELQKKCADCLVAGLTIMSVSLAYGAYVFSYERIIEATASCIPSLEESKAWWMPTPVASFNTGLSSLKCQVQVISRMLFGLLMILTITYLLLQRSVTTKQTMPITFFLLLLGLACGLAGKFCVDTLGGSGYHWLVYWEILCLLHFFSNIWTSVLFFILHGPVNVAQSMKSSSMVPHWVRRLFFYSTVLLVLPLFCGLMPFATPSEWKDHFKMLLYDMLIGRGD